MRGPSLLGTDRLLTRAVQIAGSECEPAIALNRKSANAAVQENEEYWDADDGGDDADG